MHADRCVSRIAGMRKSRLRFACGPPVIPDSIASGGIMESALARLGYLKPMRERPYHYAYEPPRGVAWQNCELDLHDMPIADARGSRPSLDAEGFEVRDAPSRVSDFFEEEVVTDVY